MLGKGFLKKPASDPQRIADACARAQRVLLCMTDLHIGNFAVSTPAMKAIQRALTHRGVTADCLVARGFVPLAQRLLDPATIIPHEASGSFLGDIAGLRRTRRRTRGRYDVLIALSGGIRGSVLARSAGVRTTIGLDRYRRSGLYTLRLEDRSPAHAMERYAQFGACAGNARPIIEPYSPLESDDEAITTAITAAGVNPDEPLTILHPGAGKTHRRWPADRFAQAADHAIERLGHAVAILTPPGEGSTTDGLLRAMRRPDRARPISLPLALLLPLFDHARLLVCNESGPMHLASMTRCAIVALYGPTDPARWSPIRTGPEVAVLRNGEAIASIETATVTGAMDRTLAAGASASLR
jgi:heptosyltransferase-3